MRILQLIKHCNLSNGHVNVAVDLACLHVQAGHAVTFASAGGDYVDFLSARGVEHHIVVTGRSPVGAVSGLAALVALCRKAKPDVIHAHMMSSAVLGFLASRLLGIPLVTTMHNSFDRHSVLMRLGDAVVAVSEAERQLLLSRGYPERKLTAIRNGTLASPREALADDAPLPPFRTPCIATVCGLHPRKGVHHLIAAFAQIASRHPEWHLNIIGVGPSGAELKAQVEAAGLDNRVHFIGAVLNPHPLLRQADIFALASLADPSALVLVEGRAAGCAMVATAVGGTAEALAFGTAGHLVEAGHPEAMAAVFDALMSDPERLADWRRKASADLETFGADTTANKYLALYRRLQQHHTGACRTQSATQHL
ncbi:glycosyltransferase family 4 protein [Lichenihabitans sp. Uapishka_5]|uniref:glycosyltransferase family 4 protein n=1 Tax=Lichenihabitans sp. Uapishka_5 TaxID=3037302 RepID=UPI0029E7FE11|nr:glycosyltransferase family 4 protein [Lichenihabitans sp. Uapishka_5]MDX7950403.1 glycosyltransferase family 4 protein [Lichenihabitans sp. Uapishka_5]